MSLVYPVQGYRTSGARAQSGRGFQTNPAARHFRVPMPLVPANDNPAKPPRPANDNQPRLPSARQVGAAVDVTRRTVRTLTWAAGLAGRAARFNPWLNLAFTLYDAWVLMSEAQQGEEAHLELNAWSGATVAVDCGRPPSLGPTAYVFAQSQCGVSQSVFPSDIGKTNKAVVSFFPRQVKYQMGWFDEDAMPKNPLNGAWVGAGRARMLEILMPPSPTDPPAPTPYPEWVPQAPDIPAIGLPPVLVPGEVTFLDAEQLPIYAPAGVPKPLPYRLLPLRRPNPFRVPGYRREAGDAVDLPLPAVQPQAFPGPTITIEPGAPPRVVQPPNGARPVFPPPARTRERKVTMKSAAVALRVVGHVTEAVDWIKAFHDALPASARTSRYYDATAHRWKRTRSSHNPARMLSDLYLHWDQVDLRAALRNVVANEIDDRIRGELGKRQARVNRRDGRPIGYTAGSTNWGVSVPGISYGKSPGQQVADALF